MHILPRSDESDEPAIHWRLNIASHEDFLGVGVFLGRQVVFGNQFRRDGGFGHGRF